VTAFDCPRCGVTLTMSERSGIEIDYCPQCRGVWLDRGELDKILERAAPTPAGAPPQAAPPSGWAPQPSQSASAHPGRRYDDDDDDDHRYRHGGRRQKSWLSDLFD